MNNNKKQNRVFVIVDENGKRLYNNYITAVTPEVVASMTITQFYPNDEANELICIREISDNKIYKYVAKRFLFDTPQIYPLSNGRTFESKYKNVLTEYQ